MSDSATLWTVVCQAPLYVRILQASILEWEYRDGLPCPPPEDLPDPGIKPMSPMAPALQSDSLPLSHPGSQGLVGETDKSVITIWSENEQRVSSEGPLT